MKTVNILIPPILAKTLDEEETYVPVQLELQNIRKTKAGAVRERNGSAVIYNYGNSYVHLLIPEDTGYIILSDGSVNKINTHNTATAEIASSKALVHNRVRYFRYKDNIYLMNGALFMKISNNKLTRFYELPAFKYGSVIGGYGILCGADKRTFYWTFPNNIELMKGSATLTKDILNHIEYNGLALFFTPDDITIYAPTGNGAAPFALQPSLKINIGLGAENSVVQTDDSFFWFGSDKKFYQYKNGGKTDISTATYQREFNKMQNSQEPIGHHLKKEHMVQWVNHRDGKVYLFNYFNNQWFEDSLKVGSGRTALPYNTYMELGGRQFFGSNGLDGKVYERSEDHLDDDGTPIEVIQKFSAQLSKRDARCRIYRLRFVGNRSAATLDESTPEFTVNISFDNLPPVSYTLSMGGFAGAINYVDLCGVGTGSKMMIDIHKMDNVKFLLTGIYCTYQELKI